jgi:bifunctional ADP-heptose synthase (sugar kinase/adenylyltransferase)
VESQLVENAEEELLPNGLPKNYNTMVRVGVPDGSDPKNPVVVYADGVFDMYHIGHAKVLE